MSEVLIKRLQDGDKKLLKRLLDSQRELHGFYSVKALSSGAEIQKVWTMDKAKDALSRNRLYQVLSTEFVCEYVERNWEDCDVSIRLRLQIYPEGEGFARWLLCNRDSWNADATMIFAPALEAALQTDAQYGLSSYVRSCRHKTKLERLREMGADAWPWQGTEFLRAKWLGVVDVEEVRVTSHEPIKRPIVVCEGAILNGQYKLIRKLGQGGMGEVWLSEDIYWEKDGEEKEKFAIKVLLPTLDRDVRERIKHEAAMQKKLKHDNIACIRNCHIDEGNSFLVIDYIDGLTLSDYLEKRGGCLSPEKAKKILLPIAKAIDFAHEKGVVHRDIKPDNIMVETGDDGVETPYILDFGLARRSSVSRRVSVCGTEPYMPRELLLEDDDVLNSAEVLRKIDVYSFAVTAYQCLTGNLPFINRKEILDLSIQPVPLGDEVIYGRSIMQGLSKDPNLRPKRCVELLNAPQRKPQPPPPDEVVLSWEEIVRDYQDMLKACDMFDKWQMIERAHVVSRNLRTGDVRILSVSAFLDFLTKMPTFVSLVKTKNKARTPRYNLECWFTAVKRWNDQSKRDELRSEFGEAKFAVLDAIYNSITKTNEEEWT
ncbi:MAG: serine/threonine protein kinase [Kiritimatiellae bacterium]|nr:serine/threonine protein kinase [Kiritimatiellia bacterium]